MSVYLQKNNAVAEKYFSLNLPRSHFSFKSKLDMPCKAERGAKACKRISRDKNQYHACPTISLSKFKIQATLCAVDNHGKGL